MDYELIQTIYWGILALALGVIGTMIGIILSGDQKRNRKGRK